MNAALQHTAKAQAAILDLDIAGRPVFPVADALLRREVPFVFYTGRREDVDMPERFRHAEIISKPLAASDVAGAFDRMAAPDETLVTDVARMLPLLRAWSRLQVADPVGADRLVERTLQEAIRCVRAGEAPEPHERLADWLFMKCEDVLSRDAAAILN
ncbi:hypothetical protein [Roseivivax jejudonensis]|uniref:hypothetical protein n=1 Tax=Roseivivax jejudonensis TaxID=1529041 RepID=UPI0013563D8D|nr:hypothetical protein [Roseivivax jejudonensis]